MLVCCAALGPQQYRMRMNETSLRPLSGNFITKSIFTALLLFVLSFASNAQNTAVKTNVLYLAAGTMNAGVERTVSSNESIELDGYLNLFTFSDNMKWKNWMVQPEYRRWFCNTLMGSFLGAHLIGGQYNIGGVNLPFSFLGTDYKKLKDSRYEGWMAGAGVAYGYAWPLSEHWNLEAEFGFGYVYTRYNSFQCKRCGEKLEENKDHHYVGPTKAALNLVYIF
jgi:hypothetical protein